MIPILVDSDVVLDLFLAREPHHTVAVLFFSAIDRSPESIDAYVSPVAIANVAYILERAKTRRYAREKLSGLRDLLKIASLSGRAVEQAIQRPHRDFEDSIQYFCALENGLTYIVTRNVGDYLSEEVAITTPSEFLEMYINEERGDADSAS